MRSLTALTTFMRPIQQFLDQDGIAEVMINEPSGLWTEKRGEMEYHKVPELTFQHLRALASLIAESTNQGISETTPLLSATIPTNGCRVQIILPPACEPSMMGFSIRKPSSLHWSLDDYERMGAFKDASIGEKENPTIAHLKEVLATGDIKMFIKEAVKAKQNIVVSGGTSTGKTTLANAILADFPTEMRIATIEDAREISLPQHPNKLHLMVSKGGQGMTSISAADMIQVCMRIRPELIVVSETRGAEAMDALRAMKTGHIGFTTIHADSCGMALQQFKILILQAGLGMPPEYVMGYVKSSIDVVIQVRRGKGGVRFVSEIYYAPVHSKNVN